MNMTKKEKFLKAQIKRQNHPSVLLKSAQKKNKIEREKNRHREEMERHKKIELAQGQGDIFALKQDVVDVQTEIQN